MNDDTRLARRALRPALARQGRLRRTRRNGVYAALDLGTNNCRLLIASPAGDSFRVVDLFSRIIRLGEGISATGSHQRGGDRPRHRSAEHLQRQDPLPQGQTPAADRNRSLPCGRQCRQLSQTRVAAETGIRLEVIDRETEATLAVIGCSPLLDRQGARRDPVRHRRRVDRTGPDRARSGRAGCAAADQGLDVDPARRRHAGRAFRRQRRDGGILCADGSGRSRNMSRRSRPNTARTCATCICSAHRAR